MKIIHIFLLLFIFLFLNTESRADNIKKLYPYKQIEYTKILGEGDYQNRQYYTYFYKNNHTILISISWDILVFYDIETGKKYNKKINIQGYSFKQPRLSPDYKYIILDCYKLNYEDSDKNMVVLYDLEKNTYTKLFQGRNYVLDDSNFSNDSKYFLLRVEDDVHIYNVKTKKREYLYKNVFYYYLEPSYLSCCSEGDKDFLVMGKEDIKIRNLKTGKIVKNIPEGNITNYRRWIKPKLSNDGKYIIAANHLYETKTMKKVIDLGDKNNIGSYSFSKDSKSFTCGLDSNKNLFVYYIKDKTKTTLLLSPKNKENYPYIQALQSIDYSNDDKYILAMGLEYITIWKIK